MAKFDTRPTLIQNTGVCTKRAPFIKGAGLALRLPHLDSLIQARPQTIQWIELLGDNYLISHLPFWEKLLSLRSHYPFVIHLTGLSLGAKEPLDEHYLQKVDALIERTQPAWISDHLSWNTQGKIHLHDLIPVPFSKKLLHPIADKIKRLQDRWQRPFLIENISSYLCFSPRHQEYSEAAFLNRLFELSGAKGLLDINNVFVSSVNHQTSAQDFLDEIDAEHIAQIHLAGFTQQSSLLIDTHSRLIDESVWRLFQNWIEKNGPTPTVLEWDHELPEFQILLNETEKIKHLLESPCLIEAIS